MKTIVKQLNEPKEDYIEITMDGDKIIAKTETRFLSNGYVQCSGFFMLPGVNHEKI
jgi:hypothetical protein